MPPRGPTEHATTRHRLLNVPPSGAADLTPPDILADDANALTFWRQHAAALAEADLLSPQDADSFALLCKVYSRVVRWERRLDAEPKLIRPWLDCQGKYIALAKQFALFPVQRKQNAVAFGDNLNRHDDLDTFDL